MKIIRNENKRFLPMESGCLPFFENNRNLYKFQNIYVNRQCNTVLVIYIKECNLLSYFDLKILKKMREQDTVAFI